MRDLGEFPVFTWFCMNPCVVVYGDVCIVCSDVCMYDKMCITHTCN